MMASSILLILFLLRLLYPGLGWGINKIRFGLVGIVFEINQQLE